jgi:hypothetical protein
MFPSLTGKFLVKPSSSEINVSVLVTSTIDWICSTITFFRCSLFLVYTFTNSEYLPEM